MAGKINGNSTAQAAPSNGQTNGHANGSTNGHTNGHTNGNTNGDTNGYSNGHADSYTNGGKHNDEEDPICIVGMGKTSLQINSKIQITNTSSVSATGWHQIPLRSLGILIPQ